MAVAGELACVWIEQIQSSVCAYPKVSDSVPQKRGYGVVAQTARVGVVVPEMRERVGHGIKPVQTRPVRASSDDIVGVDKQRLYPTVGHDVSDFSIPDHGSDLCAVETLQTGLGSPKPDVSHLILRQARDEIG